MKEHLKQLWEDWKKLDAGAKAPYEAQAASDANRYRQEVSRRMVSMQFQ